MKKDIHRGYTGRIGNTAQQYVEAPVKPSGLGAKSKVIRGGDLRAGRSKG